MRETGREERFRKREGEMERTGERGLRLREGGRLGAKWGRFSSWSEPQFPPLLPGRGCSRELSWLGGAKRATTQD